MKVLLINGSPKTNGCVARALKEAETVTSYKWEYGDPLYIRIKKDGGLSKGSHKIALTVATRTAYIPVPLEGNCERVYARL